MHEHHFDDKFVVLQSPYGANRLLLAHFPTLKRGANHLCSSGAVEIGTSSINESEPVRSTNWNQFDQRIGFMQSPWQTGEGSCLRGVHCDNPEGRT